MDTFATFIAEQQRQGMDTATYGPGNFLFVCLEVIVHSYLLTTPLLIPRMTSDNSPYTRYHDYYHDRNPVLPSGTLCYAEQSFPMGGTAFSLVRLQDGILQRHELLLDIHDFLLRNFDTNSRAFETASKSLVGRLERDVKRLELHAQHLADTLNMLNTEQSTTMAEKNIKESERMMICKYLCILPHPDVTGVPCNGTPSSSRMAALS